MKNLLKISVASILMLFLASCTNDDNADSGGGGSVPSNGWKIGSTNYTTAFTMKNVGQPNSVNAFSAMPGTNNLNSLYVLFNNVTGIAAGTYKIVTKPNQSDLLANEIMIGAGTNYSNASGQYEKDYVAVIGQTINATVTITGGKVKIVIPQVNIYATPITASSPTTTLSGTIVEQ